jgi:hypothetical protein
MQPCLHSAKGQGVWCSRALWRRMQQALVRALDDSTAMRAAAAQTRAQTSAQHEQAAIAGLVHEHKHAEQLRRLELQVPDPELPAM